jgi:predicted nucleotide-binding protein (sugar kinase/HSP70/actin superfamily)
LASAEAGGRALLRRLRAERRAAAVVLARPYHADPGIQHGISTELAARGVPVLGICALPRDAGSTELDLSGLAPRITNSSDAEKLWAARSIAGDPHLLGVELSSFRCGQDAAASGILGQFLDRAGRPLLRLHDLDEDRPAASLRIRLDTFAETVRRYERVQLGRAA